MSRPFLNAIGAQVGIGLARLSSIRQTMNAEKAERLDDLKSAILDAMSHEIRNPLNSVKIAVTTLLSGNPGDETCRREMLSIIDEEADRMDRLLDHVARMARVEATMLSVKKSDEDVARLIPARDPGNR